MATQVLVPPLSQTMDTLVLVEWLKSVGDPVVKGEALFTVETDKSTLEVEAPASGILAAIYAQPQDEVTVRAAIALIADPEEQTAPAVVPAPAAQAIPGNGAGAETHAFQPTPTPRAGRVFASPRARALARRENISLNDLTATGTRGMIVERDVRAYLEARAKADAGRRLTPVARRMAAENALDIGALASETGGAVIRRADVEAVLGAREAAPPAAPKPDVETANAPAAGVLPVAAATIGRLVKLTPLRRTIARRMQESHLASAPVTLTRLLDATELVALRGRILKALSADAPRPTYTDFLIMIVARALLAHPALNATYDGESLREYDAAHVAVAVDTDRGLLAPVIRDAQGLGLLDVARARAELAHRAVAGTPAAGDLDGGTFTLTNLGTLGVDSFTPIINPPQLAILGVGRIYSAPAAHEGEIKLREMMHLSLTFDHRFVDGAPAARFLQDVVRRIETPDLIWM